MSLRSFVWLTEEAASRGVMSAPGFYLRPSKRTGSQNF